MKYDFQGQNPTPLIQKSAVSIRDEGFACRFYVDGADVAREILAFLSNFFVFKTSEPMWEQLNPPRCIFRVAYGSQLTFRKLTSLLLAMPRVGLSVESASEDAE